MTNNQKTIADLKEYVNFYLDGNKSVQTDKLLAGLIDGLRQIRNDLKTSKGVSE